MSEWEYIDDGIKQFVADYGSPLVCAEVEYTADVCSGEQTFCLRKGHKDQDLACFYDSLHIEYNKGHGMQHVVGTLWFADGSWAERAEYDGSEWWESRTRPPTPEQCEFVDAMEDEDECESYGFVY